MKVEKITVTAELTRHFDDDECKQLFQLLGSKKPIFGLVDQFQWMPFIVAAAYREGDFITFDLLMVSK